MAISAIKHNNTSSGYKRDCLLRAITFYNEETRNSIDAKFIPIEFQS